MNATATTTTLFPYPTMFGNANASQGYTSPPSDSQINLYGAQQISPAHSASNTPLNVSPTSPRNPNMVPSFSLFTRPRDTPKVPLYVPAVLRPTERPHRPSPLTPPRSVHGSTDSLDGSKIPLPASRTSTSDGKGKATHVQDISEEPVAEQPTGEIQGLPTRTHWKPDADAIVCDAPICQKTFNLFERRHHCRHCGHLFCNTHSHYTIPLDQDAEFHPNGTESRACKHCWEQYRRWHNARASRKNSISSDVTTLPGTPTIGVRRGKAEESLKSPVATSVPRDWNWSTF